MSLPWTKYWVASDDGTTLRAVDLRNIQDDVSSGLNTVDATIAGLSSVYAPVSTFDTFVFWNNELISYENNLVFAN
jgi:hypothetical protein